MKEFSLSQPPLYKGVCLAYPDEQIVQAVLGQITWYHNIALLDKLKSPEERLWYALPNRRTRLYAVMFSFTRLKVVYTVAWALH
jgi:predicted nuclease of restriction endonuclease-like (RecB) superfamily